MNVKEAVREGIKIIGVASVVLVPGCKVNPAKTVDTFPQVASPEPAKPTRTFSKKIPDYVNGCLPVEDTGGVIKSADGIRRVSTGKRNLVLLKTESGDYIPLFPGQPIPSTAGQLLLCQRNFK